MAESSEKRAACVLQLTDTHLHASLDGRMHGVNTQQSFDAVLNNALADSRWPPDAIIVSGDIVQDESLAGYQRFRDLLESLDLPVFCIPGNHDDPLLMRKVLTTQPFQLCGNAKLGEWRVIFLSTFHKGQDWGALGPDELAGLEESLSQCDEAHVLICMHHQPLPTGSAWLDGVGLRDADKFLETVDRHDRIRVVLWGHVHQKSDQTRNGVRYLSTPSTCFQFLPNSDTAAIDTRPPGFRWLALEPDGNVSTEVGWAEISS